MSNASNQSDGPCSVYRIFLRTVKNKTSNGAPQVEVVLGVLAAQNLHVELSSKDQPAQDQQSAQQGGKEGRQHKRAQDKNKINNNVMKLGTKQQTEADTTRHEGSAAITRDNESIAHNNKKRKRGTNPC